jgi:hypothetical protein
MVRRTENISDETIDELLCLDTVCEFCDEEGTLEEILNHNCPER